MLALSVPRIFIMSAVESKWIKKRLLRLPQYTEPLVYIDNFPGTQINQSWIVFNISYNPSIICPPFSSFTLFIGYIDHKSMLLTRNEKE